MRRSRLWMCVAGVLACGVGCADDGGFGPSAEPGEVLSGGDATVFDTSDRAFGRPVPTLDRDHERAFFRGRALFRDDWVVAPASTDSRDGLGPLFNARSCEACHVRDGRGRPPLGDETMGTMLLRLSGPDGAPEPTYGGQLQPLAIPGVAPEGDGVVEYDEVPGAFDHGDTYSLRAPRYRIDALAYGPMVQGVQMSPRVAPMMIGLGLLEAVPGSAMRDLADPDDADGDGISGRVNTVIDVEAGGVAVGRFGLKANQPSIRQQAAGAFNGDLGLTSALFPTSDCTDSEPACLAAPNGGEQVDGELLAPILADVTVYSLALAVPARRDVDDEVVLTGKQVFTDIGCATCHVPVLTTGTYAPIPALSDQVIRPYTDLLLHDMGPDLADERPDHDADGREWRTPPLWGLGLLETVNGHTFLLHDGRARGFVEAILWHGGEAQAARDAFAGLPAGDRDAVVRFLESL